MKVNHVVAHYWPQCKLREELFTLWCTNIDPAAVTFYFHPAQRHSVTTVGLNCYNMNNATQGSSHNNSTQQLPLMKRIHVPRRSYWTLNVDLVFDPKVAFAWEDNRWINFYGQLAEEFIGRHSTLCLPINCTALLPQCFNATKMFWCRGFMPWIKRFFFLIVRHSSPGHSSPKTFITPLLNSDVHHLGLSSPPT